MRAHYLSHSAYPIEPGDEVLTSASLYGGTTKFVRDVGPERPAKAQHRLMQHGGLHSLQN